MNAVSGKNLTVVFSSMKSMREWPTTSAVHSAVSWTKRGLPDDSDMHLGVSDPRKPVSGP
jgi:hypothetical protein